MMAGLAMGSTMRHGLGLGGTQRQRTLAHGARDPRQPSSVETITTGRVRMARVRPTR